jgi:hypothetical protein
MPSEHNCFPEGFWQHFKALLPNFFYLDSICPTGVGKVAGVKIEIDEEKGMGEWRE